MPSERKLPIDDFVRTNRPNGKVSALLDYLPEILTLRSKKYTLQQICEWLSANDVRVTVQALSKFLIVENQRALGSKGGQKPNINAIPAAKQRAKELNRNPLLLRVEGAKDAGTYNPVPAKIEISED